MKKSLLIIALGFSLAQLNAQMLQHCLSETGKEFEKGLNAVINDFPNNLANINLGEIPAENDSYSNDAYTSVSLPEAEKCYLTTNLLSSKMKFIASFPDVHSEEEGNDWFDYLVATINACAIEQSFVLLALDESEDALGRNQSWLIFDWNDTADDAYSDMVVELALLKLFEIDDELNFQDKWSVVLRVRHISENDELKELFKD